MAETLDQAVERIAGRIEGAHERFFDGRIHRDGCKRCAIEAAIRQGIAWAYRDAAREVRDFSWVLPMYESAEVNGASDDAGVCS